jgi:molybdenum cofactor biosynthesis protein B
VAEFASDHSRDLSGIGKVAVVTLSDTRTSQNDIGGDTIVELATRSGHRIVKRILLKEDPRQIAETVQQLADDTTVEVILITGGTGIARRDTTYETIAGMLTREIPGYGELFRSLSFKEIGTAAMLSRAQGGLLGQTLLFTMPGSPSAVRLAMEQLILPELGHLLQESQR